VLGPDSFDDMSRDCGGTSRLRSGFCWRSSRPAALGEQPLQLVGGYQMRTRGHLDRLDEREHMPVEGRAADAERLGCLRSRVGKTLDARRLAQHYRCRLSSSEQWQRLPLRLAGFALQATA